MTEGTHFLPEAMNADPMKLFKNQFVLAAAVAHLKA